MLGEDKAIKFSGCKSGIFLFFYDLSKGRACTIVLRGSSQHILAESERSLHDALCVLMKTVQNHKVFNK